MGFASAAGTSMSSSVQWWSRHCMSLAMELHPDKRPHVKELCKSYITSGYLGGTASVGPGLATSGIFDDGRNL